MAEVNENSSGAGSPRTPIRQTFTPEEDARLHLLVMKHGQNWKLIASEMPNRSVRQCRERYQNYLAPGVLNGPWSQQEDKLLYEKYQIFGRKWTIIARFFKNRSGANVKNRWTQIQNNYLPKTQIQNKTENVSLSPPTVPSDPPPPDPPQQTLLPPINELSNPPNERRGINILNMNIMWNNSTLDPLLTDSINDTASRNSVDKFRNFKGFAGRIW